MTCAAPAASCAGSPNAVAKSLPLANVFSVGDVLLLDRYLAQHRPDLFSGSLSSTLLAGGRSNLTYAVTDGSTEQLSLARLLAPGMADSQRRRARGQLAQASLGCLQRVGPAKTAPGPLGRGLAQDLALVLRPGQGGS